MQALLHSIQPETKRAYNYYVSLVLIVSQYIKQHSCSFNIIIMITMHGIHFLVNPVTPVPQPDVLQSQNGHLLMPT